MIAKYTFFIVTPSYNQAHFIKQTIKSVLSQHGDFTIHYHIVDGGSTDGTKEILKNLPQQVSWISEKDKGQTDAINKGVGYFKDFKNVDPERTFFAYINSDDYYLPNTFEKVIDEFLKHPKFNWIVGDAVIVNEKGVEIQMLVRIYKTIWRKFISKKIQTILNPIPQPSTFIRWSAIKKTGLFNEKLKFTMDYEYWLRLMNTFGNPIISKSVFSAFRIHKSSKGGSMFNNQFIEELEVASKHTNNTLDLWLHKMHNNLINYVYIFIK